LNIDNIIESGTETMPKLTPTLLRAFYLERRSNARFALIASNGESPTETNTEDVRLVSLNLPLGAFRSALLDIFD